MEKFVIGGGTPLFGDVFVSGSKNAALPLLFATIVTGGTSEIGNLPDISDIRVTLSILSAMGAKVSYLTKNRVRISTDTLTGAEPPPALTSKIRASTYLLGAMLARFGRARIGGYGGCDFSARPIDMHIAAARAFGAVSDGGTLGAAHLTGGEITFYKNLPQNHTELAQTLLSLSPVLSRQTILENLPWVADAGEELRRRAEEEKEETK